MELREEEVQALYSEPSVRVYERETVSVVLLKTGEAIEADCYNLPGDRAPAGTNPAYARELSRLVEALGLDAAYARRIAAFGAPS